MVLRLSLVGIAVGGSLQTRCEKAKYTSSCRHFMQGSRSCRLVRLDDLFGRLNRWRSAQDMSWCSCSSLDVRRCDEQSTLRMRNRRNLVFSAIVLAATGCGTENGQPAATPTVVTYEIAACDTCQLFTEEIATLGAGLPSHNPTTASFVRMAAGRLYVGPTTEPGTIAVFDSAGTFVHAIGREGAGPGEFRQLAAIFGAEADSILAFQRGGMVDVVSSSGRSGRRIAAPGHVYDIALLSNGRAVVAGSREPTLVQIVAPNPRGNLPIIVKDSTETAQFDYYVARAADGFWVASGHELRFQRFRDDGTLVEALQLRAPQQSADGGQPRTIDIEFDSVSGLLWVLRLHTNPKPDSSKLEPRRFTGQGEQLATTPGARALTELFDFEVLCIDTRNRRLVGRTMLEASRAFYTPGGIYSYNEDEDGFVSVSLWRLRPQDASVQDPSE